PPPNASSANMCRCRSATPCSGGSSGPPVVGSPVVGSPVVESPAVVPGPLVVLVLPSVVDGAPPPGQARRRARQEVTVSAGPRIAGQGTLASAEPRGNQQARGRSARPQGRPGGGDGSQDEGEFRDMSPRTCDDRARPSRRAGRGGG